MANASYKTYRLEYQCPINGEYHRVKNESGNSRKFTGIKNARAAAYKLLLEKPSIERVMITKGKTSNYVTGFVKRGNGVILWSDYYYVGNGRTRLLNRDGSVRD